MRLADWHVTGYEIGVTTESMTKGHVTGRVSHITCSRNVAARKTLSSLLFSLTQWHAGTLSAYVEDAEDALVIGETPVFVGVVAEEEVDEAAHKTETHQEKAQHRNAKMTVHSSPNDSSKSA